MYRFVLTLGSFVGIGSLIALSACSDSGTGGAGGVTASSASSGSSTTTSGSTTSSGTSSASGSGTSSSSSTGTGGMAQAECSTKADCKLEDDCCACAGLPANAMVPQCNMGCTDTACTVEDYKDTLDCQAGRCVAGFDCDQTTVACAQPSPQCPAGETASVVGLCWGPCVPANQCAYVTDCAQCGPGQACARYGGGIMQSHCVDVPPECNGTPTCACMGQSLCGSIPCGDAGNGELDCQIP